MNKENIADLIWQYRIKRPFFVHSNDPDEFAPGTLYHYTGPTGVKGILESRHLWATNFSFMNDPTEVLYGLELACDILQDMKGQDTGGLLAAIEKSLCKQATSEVYVCSFTKCRDDLSQWRAYGAARSERYCIGFKFTEIEKMAEEKMTEELVEVEYNKGKQSDLIRKEIDLAIDLVTKESLLQDDDIQEIAERVAAFIARRLPQMKAPSYEAEEEWRVILWVPGNDVSKVNFDTTRGVVRPYVTFPTNHEERRTHCHGEEVNKPQPLPVTELLVLAPGRKDISVKVANMLLRKAGIREDVKAEKSKVPFAEW